ncbi:hypothetical protein HGRIS_014333 [Hohenbuehelia grisea]
MELEDSCKSLQTDSPLQKKYILDTTGQWFISKQVLDQLIRNAVLQTWVDQMLRLELRVRYPLCDVVPGSFRLLLGDAHHKRLH